MVHHILHRWSPRAYADKDVPVEDLKKGFEAARWAASSFNEQPWRFLVGRRGDVTYQKIFDSLVPFNQSWAKSAPVLILSVCAQTFAHNGEVNLHSSARHRRGNGELRGADYGAGAALALHWPASIMRRRRLRFTFRMTSRLWL